MSHVLFIRVSELTSRK